MTYPSNIRPIWMQNGMRIGVNKTEVLKTLDSIGKALESQSPPQDRRGVWYSVQFPVNRAVTIREAFQSESRKKIKRPDSRHKIAASRNFDLL